MELTIDKDKLYKGLSYPMKTSFLKEALESAGFDGHVHLQYWIPQGDKSLCRLIYADYRLVNMRVENERFFIRTGACLSQQRKALEQIMKESVIPELVSWMIESQNLPDDSTRKTGRRFFANYENGDLSIEKC